MIIFLILVFLSFFLLLENLFSLWLIPVFIGSLLFLSLGDFFVSPILMGVLGVDYFSVFIIFITVWVFYFCVFYFKRFISFYYVWFMFFSLVLCFLMDNFFLFYFFFELVFLLMFVFLLRWGKTIERIQASFYMFFYTFVFSLPFFVFMVYCFNDLMSLSFFSLFLFDNFWRWIFLFVIIVFIVKLPLYGVHLWLPKAHVEAPVTGSILLAGVLLKLGAYGFYRFFPFLVYFTNCFFFWNIFFYLSLIGGLVVSMVCLRQRDLKIIIAYSSVVHISFIIVGFISFREMGLIGALLILVAHGFISPFLFLGLNYIYEVFNSRRVFLLKGIIVFVPIFCLFWFFGVILNIGFPSFISFFSEILITIGLRFLRIVDWFFILVFFFFCGVYNIYLYVLPSHGGSFFVDSFNFRFEFLFLRFVHFFFILVFPVMCFWLISLIKILVCGTKDKY